MSVPAFFKRVWGRPNPARWRAKQEVAAVAEHGHQEHACYHCPSPANCDCPCDVCIRRRRMVAGTACAACGSMEGVVDHECERCRAGREEVEAEEEEKPKSWIQQALDAEWAAANFAGPGCPFCDAIIGCGCLARRAEMMEAESKREERERLAAALRGACACTEYGECDRCRAEEDSRCQDCGAYAGQACRDGCGEHEEEDRHSEDDHCSGCYPGCHGCQADFDPRDPWGDGAPEEHREEDW
jgi:hypothetical protein